MKGMIFAAGVGSRLKPWTDCHPKALVEVGEKPVIGHVIDRMTDIGIGHIIVNVHHFADQIADYLRSEYRNVHIDISDETSLLLDTGGGLRKALPLIGYEPVLIHNADILCSVSLDDMIVSHDRQRCDATLLVQPRKTSRYFLFERDRLRGWTDLRNGAVRPGELTDAARCEMLAFGGIHIISPQIYGAIRDYAPDNTPFSITDFYIDRCGLLDIEAYRLPEGRAWFDVGKPETLEQARDYFKREHHIKDI